MKTGVILNPAAGRGRAQSSFEAIRPRLGEFELFATQGPGDAKRQAALWRDLFDRVLAAGGDGTLGEVADGLCGGRAALGILPIGTGNDFARTIGIGTNLDLALNALDSPPEPIDLFEWETESASGRGINVAGCGFDAQVAEKINCGYRWISGTGAYLLAVLQTLATARPARIELRTESDTESLKALLVAVANARSYGGGMRVAPNASVRDGLLDVVSIGDVSKWEFLRTFPRVFAGTHLSHPAVVERKLAELEVRSEPPLPVLVDGELVGTTPVRFRTLPDAIRCFGQV